MEELRDEVLNYAREGKPLNDLVALVKMSKYEKWAGYEQMVKLNVEGMYRMVQANRRGN
ncbi:MAG: hypothetical protein ACT4P2_13375 [Pseudomonadota bacterium]